MSARSALLALCGLLLAGSRLATGRPFERPPGGLLGLTFPVVKSGDEQQQQQQQAVASDTPAAHLDEGLKRALLLRGKWARMALLLARSNCELTN